MARNHQPGLRRACSGWNSEEGRQVESGGDHGIGARTFTRVDKYLAFFRFRRTERWRPRSRLRRLRFRRIITPRPEDRCGRTFGFVSGGPTSFTTWRGVLIKRAFFDNFEERLPLRARLERFSKCGWRGATIAIPSLCIVYMLIHLAGTFIVGVNLHAGLQQAFERTI